MTEHRAERPPRLMTACAYLGVIGAFQVVQAIIVLTGWYSESGEKQVKRLHRPARRRRLDRGDAETIYRVYLGILAVLAASVLVFAVYTAMGHAVSRIMLTITAPLMALLGITQGSFVSILLSFMTLTFMLQLWNADVRRWFALLAVARARAGRGHRLASAPAADAASEHEPPPAAGRAAAVDAAPSRVRAAPSEAPHRRGQGPVAHRR